MLRLLKTTRVGPGAAEGWAKDGVADEGLDILGHLVGCRGDDGGLEAESALIALRLNREI